MIHYITGVSAKGLHEVENIDAVLDVSSTGEMIGIEIISLAFYAKGHGIAFNQLNGLSGCAYDSEFDAFYCKISDDSSFDQKVVTVTLLINQDGLLHAIKIE